MHLFWDEGSKYETVSLMEMDSVLELEWKVIKKCSDACSERKCDYVMENSALGRKWGEWYKPI
jgi:hypothetical protein